MKHCLITIVVMTGETVFMGYANSVAPDYHAHCDGSEARLTRNAISAICPVTSTIMFNLAIYAFNAAAADVKNLKSKPTDQELLDLYSYFKQVTVGDTDTDRPGMLDFKGKAKWDSWNSRKGMSKADAEAAYIKIVDELKAKFGMA